MMGNGSASLSVHGRRFKRQHPRSQQFDAGAAVHGPLEGLQPVDLTFGLSAAPSLGDCIPDGVEVSTQRSRELLHGGDAGAPCVAEPSVKLAGIIAAKNAAEPHRKADAYPNLQLILTKPIDWELIRQQYDQMVKYGTAVRLGTAETESILRRFARSNIQHPAYKAFAELGRAVKTIFLCRFLQSEGLRREINEGLNVIEQWNSANDFIFFARHGEMVSNRREDHETSMLALHLLQNCMVYINTLMLQQVLTQPQWPGKLTPRDLRALTPLIWEHVNPYGRFELDMEARLPID
jgi:hypothetical protein